MERMVITIDKDVDKDGHILAVLQFVVHDLAVFTHPVIPGEKMTPVELAAYINDNPDARSNSAWDVVNQLDGEMQPMTRWNRLVAHTNSAVGHPALKQLGLKEGN